MDDETKIRICWGYYRRIGTTLYWEANCNLRMTAEEQLADNLRSIPDFKTVIHHPMDVPRE